jgi:DNA excision repair protein ERCC-1
MTLLSNFGSFKKIVHASPDELSSCPGLGSQKVKRLLEAFDQPFLIASSED